MKKGRGAHRRRGHFRPPSACSEHADHNCPQKQEYESNCHDLQLTDHGYPPVPETFLRSPSNARASIWFESSAVESLGESPEKNFVINRHGFRADLAVATRAHHAISCPV